MKTCLACQQELPITAFASYRRGKTGIPRFRNACIPCRKSGVRYVRPSKTKTCPACERALPYSEWTKHCWRADSGWCNDCRSRKPPGRRYRTDAKYQCARCSKILPSKSFPIRQHQGNRVAYSYCKECVSIRNREINRRVAEREGRTYVPRGPMDPTKRRDITHDYGFARRFLGFSQMRAVQWVASGYSGIEESTIEDWHLEETLTKTMTFGVR